MTKRKDEVGNRYGRLMVISFAASSGTSKHGKRAYWNCQCDCGRLLVVDGGNLRTGNTSSCGCYHKEKMSGEGSPRYSGGMLKAEYRRQQRSAKIRKLDFTLIETEVEKLFSYSCFYCGQEPQEDNRGLVRNGIDRMDNRVGYIIDNVVSCCWRCNRQKDSFDSEEFIKHSVKIANYFKGSK